MGLIRAAASSVSGTVADQWLEVVEPENMSNTTIMAKGIVVNKKGNKGKTGVITDGSIIRVGENQMMLLVDGGKIIDYSAEPGYYKVSNDNAPSLFNGDFQGALSDAYNRFRFGGTTPYQQEVFFINTQEIKDIPFGTNNAINYFDNFYNAELYLRAYGYYSIRIINPIKFYVEMVSRSATRMEIDEFRKICLAEFLTAFQTAIGKMSVEGVRISHISSKTSELAKHMSTILDEDWEQRRGMRIESVGIASISYDDNSKRLINMRNEGAMLGDPNIRTGYVQGAAARGVEAAGSNSGGATAGFVGLNMGMNSAGNIVGAAGQVNAQQPAPSQPNIVWTCSACGVGNGDGKFCSNCGKPRPQSTGNHCTQCGQSNNPDAKFCSNCGSKL